jgi:hypothetical protein
MRRPIPRRVDKSHLIARLPRGLRPRLDRSQIIDLALAHTTNHGLIRTGQADEAVLWKWVGGMLTWYRVAVLLGLGEPEMREQLLLCESVLQRYGRTGRVGFSGPELQTAAEGVQVMDQLAAAVDRPTAVAAADWSEALINRLAIDGAANARLTAHAEVQA